MGILHGFAQLEQLVPSEGESVYKYQKFHSAVSGPQRLDAFMDMVRVELIFSAQNHSSHY